MSGHRSDIETVARGICERQYRELSAFDLRRLNAEVDRYWHCVAAELEAGLIDETGSPCTEFGYTASIAAYRDWRVRHPDYIAPDRPFD